MNAVIFLLQLLAFFEHYYYRIVDYPTLLPLSIILAQTTDPYCQKLLIGLIYCIICDVTTANTTYRYGDPRKYVPLMILTYIVFITANVGKFIIPIYLMSNGMPEYMNIILQIIMIHSAVGFLFGLLVLAILKIMLSSDNLYIYRSMRRMMEGIPDPI